MSMIQSDLLLGQEGGAGYAISRSLRFNSSDSAYLSRTPASAGNRTTWSFSAWVKRSKLGASQFIFTSGEGWGAGSGDAYLTGAAFGADDKLYVYWRSSYAPLAGSAGVYRDPSAWYHITLRADGSTLKAYVNGTEVCSGAISGNGGINSTQMHSVGVSTSSTYFGYADFLIADIHFIDGQALTPSSFAETNATTGQWVPKAYTGSYGTNGFRLDFSDNSAATATTLGKDRASSNNWTPNNLSVTAGAGNDSLVDTPTSYGTDTGAGGEVRGNYCTWNPLANTAVTLSNGNLDGLTIANNAFTRCNSTISVSSGKWYFEVLLNVAGTNTTVGIGQNQITSQYPGQDALSYVQEIDNARKGNSDTFSSYGSSLVAGDVFMCAFDLDNNKVFFGKNGSWFGSSNPASGTNPAYTLSTGTYCPITRPYGNLSGSISANFGQRQWAYAAPSGFRPLVDTLLPAPVNAKSASAFDIALYTGNSSTQSITLPGGMSPDLVWVKTRSAATYYHALYDAVRGTGPSKSLYSNATDAEGAQSIYTNLTSFDSSGFSLGSTSPNNNILNQSGQTFVAWCWDAGSSTVTNTQGSITSQVRANASAGFSIVTYTGNRTGGATVGHGLGVAPAMIIVKSRAAGGFGWRVYHIGVGKDATLKLNETAAQEPISADWNNTSPSSTVFTLGTTAGGNYTTNDNVNYVAYCFAPVAGYSSFGSYTGNGSADGPFVYTGFRPRWVMFKRTDSTGNWVILNTASSAYNVADKYLMPNSSQVEDTAAILDIVSNGFKLRYDNVTGNANGGTYMWAAFAESPFQYARAR